jgi:hypothetical protein
LKPSSNSWPPTVKLNSNAISSYGTIHIVTQAAAQAHGLGFDESKPDTNDEALYTAWAWRGLLRTSLHMACTSLKFEWYFFVIVASSKM